MYDGTSRVYVRRDDAIRDDFEPEELERILSLFPYPVFYTVDFSDIAFCKRVLEAIANDPQLVVDNDHGVVLPGPEFVRLLQSRRDWDWRVSSQKLETRSQCSMECRGHLRVAAAVRAEAVRSR